MSWRGRDAEREAYGVDFPTLGIEAWRWIEAHCVVPDGDQEGEPFRLTDEMVRFLLHHYRIDPERTSVRYEGPRFHYERGSQLVRPQKWGKGPFSAAIICFEAMGPALPDGWDAAGEIVGRPWPTPVIQITALSEEQPLALDTPVPTPAGWTTIGDLRVGHVVFDQRGHPVQVTKGTPVFLNADCFEVTFNDGERIVASAEHAWTIERRTLHGDQHETVTVTTRELSETHRTRSGGSRYRLAPCGPWELPEADLPVDPYLLGLWLGDGQTADAGIACDGRLRGEIEAIIKPLLEDHEALVWAGAGIGNTATFRIRRRQGLCPWGHEQGDDKYDRRCGPCYRREPRLGRFDSFRERLRNVGVLDDKHIPAPYLRASAAQRWSLLQGLIDSDGHVEANGRAGFTNTNRRIIDGIVELLTSLGILSCQRFDETVGAWRVFFVPCAERPVARLAHKVARHRSELRARRISAHRYVVGVEPVPSVPVRCIGIDTDDHLFLVGRGAVPTHNTGNVFKALLPMIRGGPLDQMIPDTGLTRINLPGGGEILPVTAGALSKLGQRITLALEDETHGWKQASGGIRLSDTQKRNVAGMGGRWIETTNAWDITEGSVAQLTFETPTSVYVDYPAPIGGSFRNKAERRKALRHAYGDSVRNGPTWRGWVDLERIDVEVEALMKRDPSQAERYFGNRVHAGEDVLFDIEAWANNTAADTVIADGSLITIGVDGARYEDALAIIATDVASFYQWPLYIEQRPENAGADYEHDLEAADAAVIAACERYRVGLIYSDPQRIEHIVDRWMGRWGPDVVAEFFTNMKSSRKLGDAVGCYVTAVAKGEMSHDGSTLFARHVANARRKPLSALDDEGRPLFSMQKDRPRSANKIDAAMAAMISAEARRDAIAKGMANAARPTWFVGV